MVFLISIVLIGLGFIAWKEPGRVGSKDFKISLITLLLAIFGFGWSEAFFKVGFGMGDDDIWVNSAAGVGVAGIFLIVSVVYFFRIRTED